MIQLQRTGNCTFHVFNYHLLRRSPELYKFGRRIGIWFYITQSTSMMQNLRRQCPQTITQSISSGPEELAKESSHDP
ncbi:hypothetical protein glysoja_013431 [Glycine soja]|nr:hypothetical protein glysoja_013431 [Glycine soja]